MLNNDIVICATPQHTGTWFLIDILEKALDRKIVLFPNIGTDLDILPTTNFLAHYHLQGNYNPPIHMFNDANTSPLIDRITVNGEQNPRLQEFEIAAKQHKTVISMRDPMLSLLTRQTRHPKGVVRDDILVKDHLSIIHGFIQAANASTQGNVFLFPVDLYHRPDQRLILLQNLYTFLNIQYNRGVWLNDCKFWHKQNETQTLPTKYDFTDLPEKTAYMLHRKTDKLYTLFEEEIDLLHKHPEVQTMLTVLGYRNLPWYK